jgi:hypothetical protein
MKATMLAAAILAAFAATTAQAANEPCSGKKGGVNHCEGGKFVCNDGTISASKKTCSGGSRSSGKSAGARDTSSGGQSTGSMGSQKKGQ